MPIVCCREEADEYIDIGALNGIFVLGRSMGFIGELAAVVVRICFLFLKPPQFSYITCPYRFLQQR
jgi:hypothetical protein